VTHHLDEIIPEIERVVLVKSGPQARDPDVRESERIGPRVRRARRWLQRC